MVKPATQPDPADLARATRPVKIEVGAFAIFQTFARYSTPYRVRVGGSDKAPVYRMSSQEEAIEFRWAVMKPAVKANYLREAEACLIATGSITKE